MINELFLVDDDKVVNLIHSKVIRKSGAAQKVTAFDNAKAALETLKDLLRTRPEELPEIILLDINMPDMDGWEFLEEFEQFQLPMQYKCKVIIVSSSVDPRDKERSKKYKTVSDFISKPLTAERMKPHLG